MPYTHSPSFHVYWSLSHYFTCTISPAELLGKLAFQPAEMATMKSRFSPTRESLGVPSDRARRRQLDPCLLCYKKLNTSPLLPPRMVCFIFHISISPFIVFVSRLTYTHIGSVATLFGFAFFWYHEKINWILFQSDVKCLMRRRRLYDDGSLCTL